MNFHEVLWTNWSWISSIPLVCCTVFRFFTQDPCLKEKPKRFYVDDVFRFLLFPGLFYYSLDSVKLMLDYEEATWCSLSYLVHHIVTLAGARTTLTLDHYPWFIMAPFAMHTILLIFPHYTMLNYVYLAVIFLCFHGLLQKPWKDIDSYRWALKTSICLVIGPLVMLWCNECKNTMRG